MNKFTKSVAGVALAFSMLLTPALTQAAGLSTDQINAILNLLRSFGADLATVQNVDDSLNGRVPSLPITPVSNNSNNSTSFCYTWTKNLKVGDRGDDVEALVKALKNDGIDIPDYASSGIDGSYTFGDFIASAVTKFQEKYSSEVLAPYLITRGTGYVGNSTRAKLNALYGCVSDTGTSQQLNYNISPNSVVRNSTYNFSGSITGGSPNSNVLFYLQRPDGSMKYSGEYIGKTDSRGDFYQSRSVKIEGNGKDGVWVSWVKINGITSPSRKVTVSNVANNTPYIKIISPVGGETLTEGSSYTISWDSANIPSDAEIFVDIYNGSEARIDNPNNQIAVLPSTSTSYVWTVKSNTGWPIGAVSWPEKFAKFFGISVANAGSNQYVISVRAYSTSKGQIVFSSTDPFYIALKTTGGVTDNVSIPTIAPGRVTINSGEKVSLKVTVPSNTVSAKLFVVCPAGVSALGAYGEMCNTWRDVPYYYTAHEIIPKNNTGEVKNISPNFFTYTSDRPDYAQGISSEITINPSSSKITPLKVLSPNGGEAYYHLQNESGLVSYSVQVPNNRTEGNEVSIYAVTSLNETEYSGRPLSSEPFGSNNIGKVSEGSFYAGNFPVGKYYILAVWTDKAGNRQRDYSDSYFSIIEPAKQSSGIEPMKASDIVAVTKVTPKGTANLGFGINEVSAQNNLGSYHAGTWYEGLNPNQSGPLWVEFGWPNSPDVDVEFIDKTFGVKKFYLPAVGADNSTYNRYYWIAEDGSSYYANSSHGAGWPNMTYTEALNPKHLARKAGSSQTTLKLISPNGGETYVSGKGSISINYSATNLFGKPITAYLTNKEGKNVRSTNSKVSDLGIINMPLELAGPDNPGQYKITLCVKENDYASVCEGSDSLFTIVSSTQSSGSGASVTASLLNSFTDKAGIWDNFGPGSGNINKNTYDWNFEMRLKVPWSGKGIKSISISHDNGYEAWSTSKDNIYGKPPYPLVVFSKDAGNQINNKYFDTLPLYQYSGTPEQTYYLYGQVETETFSGATLEVKFTDGTATSTKIPSASYRPVSQTQSYVKVLSPNGGETFNVGDKVRITYSTSVYPSRALIYLNEYHTTGSKAGNINRGVLIGETPVNGIFDYTIKADPFNSGGVSGTRYKLEVCLQGGPCTLGGDPSVTDKRLTDESDNYFTIIAPAVPQEPETNTSLLKVLSPNGGEVIHMGEAFDVAWNYSGEDSGRWAYSFVKMPNGANCFLAASPVSYGKGRYSIAPNYPCPNISATVYPSTDYKLLIVVGPAGSNSEQIANSIISGIADAVDESDSYFTVVDSPSSVTNSASAINAWKLVNEELAKLLK